MENGLKFFEKSPPVPLETVIEVGPLGELELVLVVLVQPARTNAPTTARVVAALAKGCEMGLMAATYLSIPGVVRKNPKIPFCNFFEATDILGDPAVPCR